MSGAKGMLYYDVETKQKAVVIFWEGQGGYAAIAKEPAQSRRSRVRICQAALQLNQL